MSPRTKKLIGTLGLLLWLLIYVGIMTVVAMAVLPRAHWTVELLFYAIAGMAWIFPVGFLLPWMHREKGEKPR